MSIEVLKQFFKCALADEPSHRLEDIIQRIDGARHGPMQVNSKDFIRVVKARCWNDLIQQPLPGLAV